MKFHLYKRNHVQLLFGKSRVHRRAPMDAFFAIIGKLGEIVCQTIYGNLCLHLWAVYWFYYYPRVLPLIRLYVCWQVTLVDSCPRSDQYLAPRENPSTHMEMVLQIGTDHWRTHLPFVRKLKMHPTILRTCKVKQQKLYKSGRWKSTLSWDRIVEFYIDLEHERLQDAS